MATKIKKKQTVKGKAIKSAKPSASKKAVKKTIPAAKKTAQKPAKAAAKKPAPVKKPVVKAKKPVKSAVKAAPAPKKAKAMVEKPVKLAKTPAVLVEKPAKVKAPAKSRKKPTKIDKKIARTLIKIASSQRTAVATVGVQSAAMNAVRATMQLAANAANSNQPVPANQSASYSKSPAAPVPAVKAMDAKPAFKTGDVVVYPAHGVGKVDGVEAHTIGGQEVKLFRITFDHERMTLKVPVQRATGSGLRALSSKETMKNVFETMKGRPRVRRVMWSRRAQEYEQKINSGDPVAIAEVLRDLRRNAESGDQSYSERQIFQNALERLSREVAAIEKIDQEKATQKLSDLLLRKLPASAANGDDVDAA